MFIVQLGYIETKVKMFLIECWEALVNTNEVKNDRTKYRWTMYSYTQGRILFEDQQHVKSIAMFIQCSKVKYEPGEVFLWRPALSCIYLKKYEKALEFFKKFWNMRTSNLFNSSELTMTFLAQGYCETKLERHNEAEKHFKQAEKFKSGDDIPCVPFYRMMAAYDRRNSKDTFKYLKLVMRSIKSVDNLVQFLQDKIVDEGRYLKDDWRNVLDDFYGAFQKDLVSASYEDGMRGNQPTSTNITCPCGKTNMVIRNSSNGVFLGCSGYQNLGDDKCKETLNLVSGDEAISIDDTEEATNLMIKRRCDKCGTSMDNYLIDEGRKLHVCGKNPDCDGYFIEEGQFKIKGYDGPTLECHKCGSEMQLKTGRFGKYFGCLNDNCGATRALQRNGEPKPIMMEPISIPDLACLKCEDHYLLRDSMKGLFLAASKYPKNRETRAPKVSEINNLSSEISEACRFLPKIDKHSYLMSAPEKDRDGNPYVIRYNKTDDVHYLASEKDGKKIKWKVVYDNGEWVKNKKS
mgnify:CR=1 FL=1